MSGYSGGYSGGRGLNFNIASRQAEDNDCDCEVDGSFIIIPKHKAEIDTVGSPSPSNGNALDVPGTSGSVNTSVNVHQLGRQAESSASIPRKSFPKVNDFAGEASGNQRSFDMSCSQSLEDRRAVPLNGVNSSVSSVGSEASSLEEANMMLNHLTIENQKLKVLLADRNEHMKKSLDTYKNLQSSMSLIHEDHKTKYEASRSLIDQLRAENLQLKSEIIEKQTQLLECTSAITSSLTTDTNELGKIEILEQELHSKQKELERLNLQLEEQLELISEANLNREQLNDLLRRKEAELSGAKSAEANIHAYRDLQKERDTLQAAFEDSKVTIEELNKNRLKKDEGIKELSQILSNVNREVQKGKQEYDLQVEETNKLRDICNEQKKDMVELENQLRIANSLVQELQQRLETRENDIQTLTALNEKERHSFVVVNEASTSKDRENSLLLTQMALLKAQEEQTELYKTQMEEYKANFEEERRDRVSMKERKDQISEELVRVKLELENKTAELETLHRAHIQLSQDHVERNGDQSSTRSSAPPSEEDGEAEAHGTDRDSESAISPCPLCQKKFTTRNALVSHASHCGDVRGPFLFP